MEYILGLQCIQFELVALQVLNGHMWLVVTISNSMDL